MNLKRNPKVNGIVTRPGSMSGGRLALKRCWIHAGLLTLTAGMLIAARPAAAQAPGMPGGNVGFNAAVAKLFNDVPAFSAMAETTLTNLTDKSRLTIPMRMLKNGDRFRIEVDFLKMKGAGLNFPGVTAMQNLGMSRMTSLVLPKEKGMLVMFPELKFYSRVPLAEADLPSAGFKIAKRQSGKETINGQSCVRQRVTMTADDGTKTEATTWEAPGLKNFPVRMVVRSDENSTMLMDFSQVSLDAPPEELFKVPTDYRGFNSVGGLLQEAMTRAYQPGAK